MAMKYHPDVGREKSEVKFAEVQRAYEALTAKDIGDGKEEHDEFTFKLWRKGDVIAQNRKDVAGEKRKRPARPVGISSAAMLDFAGGSVPVSKGKGGDLLGDGSGGGEKRILSSVSRGKSKWTPESKTVYKGWKGDEGKAVEV